MEFQQRKANRIPNYDYNQNGAYFITICTQNRKKILSRITVGTPVPGNAANLVTLPGRGVPTGRSSTISRFVGTFKRFCNKEYGMDIWQSWYYDHVIRNRQDYDEAWQYIENNPRSWAIKNRGIE